jgi:hypothetical protein
MLQASNGLVSPRCLDPHGDLLKPQREVEQRGLTRLQLGREVTREVPSFPPHITSFLQQ